MEFNLTITLGNDAMQTPTDIADALDQTATDLRNQFGPVSDVPISELPVQQTSDRIYDLNGNRVGSWSVA